jgi:carboxymethylenebutenolidase
MKLILIVIIASVFSSFLFSKIADISTSEVTYKSGDEMIKGFLSIPKGNGPFPALIVIHEWWGLNGWIKENAKMFAEKGYVSLAVDLYRGKITTNPDEAHEIMRGLPEDRAVRDLKSAVAYLQSRSDVKKDKIGSIGWCMGGGYSLQTALNVPQLSACVINYGRLVTEQESIDKINCPILGIFGEQDRGIPPNSVKTFEEVCKKSGKQITTYIYPNVGHAFMNPNNKGGYNKETTEKAWNEIFTFFEKKLKNK